MQQIKEALAGVLAFGVFIALLGASGVMIIIALSSFFDGAAALGQYTIEIIRGVFG